VAGLMPRDCLPIRTQTQDGQTQARVRCPFSLPPLPKLHTRLTLTLSAPSSTEDISRQCQLSSNIWYRNNWKQTQYLPSLFTHTRSGIVRRVFEGVCESVG
jgi:hypothetical protein